MAAWDDLFFSFLLSDSQHPMLETHFAGVANCYLRKVMILTKIVSAYACPKTKIRGQSFDILYE